MHRGPVDIDDSESEPHSDVAAHGRRNSANRVVLAPDSGFAPSPGKQPPALLVDLSICALRSGRQIGRETDLKKVSRLSTRTAVKSSSKRDLATMTEGNESNGPVDAEQPLREVVRSVPIINCSYEDAPDRLLHVEGSRSQQSTARPSPQTIVLRWLPISVTIQLLQVLSSYR